MSGKNNKLGFTIIEITLVIFLFSLLSLFIFDSVAKYQNISKIESTSAKESINIMKVSEKIEDFVRQSSQNINIKNTLKENESEWLITDLDEPTNKMVIIKKDNQLIINENIESESISQFNILQYTNIITIKIKSNIDRVHPIDYNLYL